MNKVEMHCHTLDSDWLQTKEERLLEAKNRWINFLAITDHDKVSRNLDQIALEYWVQTCESVEISAKNEKSDKSLHLTLYARHISNEIDSVLQNTLDSKISMIEKQIEALNAKGFLINIEDFYSFSLSTWRIKEWLNKFDIARYIYETPLNYNLVQNLEPGIDIEEFYSKYFKTEWEKFPEYWILIPNYEPLLEVCKDIKEKSNGILALPHSNFTFKWWIEEFERQLPNYINIWWINALEINCRATQKWVEAIIHAKNKYGLYLTFWSDCHKTWNSDERHWELWEMNPYITEEFMSENFSEYRNLLI